MKKLLWVWIPASALVLACALLWQLAFTAPSFDPIAFNGNVLTIPAECGTERQSVSPANGKTLAEL